MRTRINSLDEFKALQAKCKAARDAEKRKILVCCGTGCVAGGNMDVYNELKKRMDELGVACEVALAEDASGNSVGLKKSGCHGFCEMGPLVRIEPEGWLYTKCKVSDVEEIINTTIIGGQFIERLGYHANGELYQRQEDIPFYKKQTRRVLEHCGHIDAESIEEYLAIDGYTALTKALFEMSGDEVIKEVTDSGLRGRGGAGFPTGKKWSQVAAHKEEPVKYIVCNGDEGDPGAFMDRSCMEGDPHKVLEGMIIAGVATGSTEGYIYVRAEYPLAVARLSNAIKQAEELGLIGDDILGSGKSFHMHINCGAGAFVCGEGSAMTASIEGNRGMPRTKPPRSVDEGLYGQPTCLNNVETFANVPDIIKKGAAWFKSVGTEGSSGTKAFALTGNVVNTGLIEVPMGTTMREVVYEIGGGIKNGAAFKAVQIGGPSGGCLTSKHLDLPLDFDSLKSVGAIIGSGGLVVMDENTCMVDTARFFMNFICDESCGKCTPCREGTTRMRIILENICNGEGTLEDLDELEEIARMMEKSSLCGLGKTAANPVLSTLANFRDEYIEHIVDKRCSAGVCQKLSQKAFVIDPEKCIGCTKCARNCPVEAITGKVKTAHQIDTTKCIQCGTCKDNCPVGAIYVDNGNKKKN
ncbi:MAG: NADH-quinone oxidoreductase subunit NuoF [Oscillospiraceae bacterium]|nr:NADH-quinone oxidoreductase subunit NuoF [Oscillospiraceae bacterium]